MATLKLCGRDAVSAERLTLLGLIAAGSICIGQSGAYANGGDTCANAATITTLPFIDAGDTNFFANDYQLTCVFGEAGDSDARCGV